MRRDFDLGNMEDQLTILSVPDLLPEQLNVLTKDNLRAREIASFDAVKASEVLKNQEGKEVIGIDIGGDKLVVAHFVVSNGFLQEDVQKTKSFQSTGGASYLEFLEEIAQDGLKKNIPVGISCAGFIKGTILLESPNAGKLTEQLSLKYAGDFANLFPTLKSLSNDAVAGVIAGAVEAKRQLPNTRNVIYIINGSGFGGAVLKDNEIIATEPGHVEIIGRLNPHKQNTPCGFLGAEYVCIESVAASKAGVENLWLKSTGEALNGRQIAAKYTEGDTLAIDLYDNSALLTAHVIKGLGNAFDFLREPADTAIVCHGGIFNVLGYGERVRQILNKNLGYALSVLFTKDFSLNACLDGAAITALT